MNKRTMPAGKAVKIIYWIVTAFLSFGMVAGGVQQMLQIGEWAYAGFFFAMSGAAVSHFVVGQSFTYALPSLILLLMTVLSWYFRPANRKIPLNYSEI